MKGGLESQEQGISAEEMFSSPIKIGTDMQMVGDDQLEICLMCRKTRPDNVPQD